MGTNPLNSIPGVGGALQTAPAKPSGVSADAPPGKQLSGFSIESFSDENLRQNSNIVCNASNFQSPLLTSSPGQCANDMFLPENGGLPDLVTKLERAINYRDFDFANANLIAVLKPLIDAPVKYADPNATIGGRHYTFLATFLNGKSASARYFGGVAIPLLIGQYYLARIQSDQNYETRSQYISNADTYLDLSLEQLNRLLVSNFDYYNYPSLFRVRDRLMQAIPAVYSTCAERLFTLANIELSRSDFDAQAVVRLFANANNYNSIAYNFSSRQGMPQSVKINGMAAERETSSLLRSLYRNCFATWSPNYCGNNPGGEKALPSAMSPFERIRPFWSILFNIKDKHRNGDFVSANSLFNLSLNVGSASNPVMKSLDQLSPEDIIPNTRGRFSTAQILILERDLEKASLKFESGARENKAASLNEAAVVIGSSLKKVTDLINAVKDGKTAEGQTELYQYTRLRIAFTVLAQKVALAQAEDDPVKVEKVIAAAGGIAVGLPGEMGPDLDARNEKALLIADATAQKFFISLSKGAPTLDEFKTAYKILAEAIGVSSNAAQVRFRAGLKMAKLIHAALGVFTLKEVKEIDPLLLGNATTIAQALETVRAKCLDEVNGHVGALKLMEQENYETRMENCLLTYFFADNLEKRNGSLQHILALLNTPDQDLSLPRPRLWKYKALATLASRVNEPAIREAVFKALGIDKPAGQTGAELEQEALLAIRAGLENLRSGQDGLNARLNNAAYLHRDLQKIWGDVTIQLAATMAAIPYKDLGLFREFNDTLKSADDLLTEALGRKADLSFSTAGEIHHQKAKIKLLQIGGLDNADDSKLIKASLELLDGAEADLAAARGSVFKPALLDIARTGIDLNFSRGYLFKDSGNFESFKTYASQALTDAGQLLNSQNEFPASTALRLDLQAARANFLSAVASDSRALKELGLLPDPKLSPAQTELKILKQAEGMINKGLGWTHGRANTAARRALLGLASRLVYLYRALVSRKPLPAETEANKAEINEAGENLKKLKTLLPDADPIQAMDLRAFARFTAEQLGDDGPIQKGLREISGEKRGDLSVEAALLYRQNTEVRASDIDDLDLGLETLIKDVLLPVAYLLGQDSLLEPLKKALRNNARFKKVTALLDQKPAESAQLVHLRGRAKFAALKSLADTLKTVGSMFRDLAGYEWADTERTARDSRISAILFQQADGFYSLIKGSARVELVQEAELADGDIIAIESGNNLRPEKEKAALEAAIANLEKQFDQQLLAKAKADILALVRMSDRGKMAADELKYGTSVRQAVKTLIDSYRGNLVGRSRDLFFTQLAGYYMRQGFLFRQTEGRVSTAGALSLNLARYLYYEAVKTGRGDLAADSELNLLLIRYVEASDKFQQFLEQDGKLKSIYTTVRGDRLLPLSLAREADILRNEIFARLPSSDHSLKLNGRSRLSVLFQTAQLFGRYSMVLREILGKDDDTPKEIREQAAALIKLVAECVIPEYRAEIAILKLQLDLVSASDKNDEEQEMENIQRVLDDLNKLRITANLGSRAATEARLLAIQAHARYAFLFRDSEMGSKGEQKNIDQLYQAIMAIDRHVNKIRELRQDKDPARLKAEESALAAMSADLASFASQLDPRAFPKESANYHLAKALHSLPAVFLTNRKDLESFGSFWLGQIAYVIAEDRQELLDIAFAHHLSAWKSEEMRGNQLLETLANMGKILSQLAGIENEADARLPFSVFLKTSRAEDFFENALETIRELSSWEGVNVKEAEKIIGDIMIESANLVSWAEMYYDFQKTTAHALDGICLLEPRSELCPGHDSGPQKKLENRFLLSLAKGYWLLGELRRYNNSWRSGEGKDFNLALRYYQLGLKTLDRLGGAFSVQKKALLARFNISLGRLYGESTWDQVKHSSAETYFRKAEELLKEIKITKLWQSEHVQINRSLEISRQEVDQALAPSITTDYTRTERPGWARDSLHLKLEYPLTGLSWVRDGRLRLIGEGFLDLDPEITYSTFAGAAGFTVFSNENFQVNLGGGFSVKLKSGPEPVQFAQNLNASLSIKDTFSLFTDQRLEEVPDGQAFTSYFMAGIKPFNLLTDSLRLAYNPLLQGLLLGVDLVRYPLFIAETDTGRIRQQISLLSNFILDYNVKIPWVLNNRLGLNFVWRAPLWGETGGFMRRGETDQVYKNAAQQFNFGLGFYPAESTIGADGDVNEVLRTLNSCSFQVYLGKNVWASETGRSYIDLYTAGGKTTCHF